MTDEVVLLERVGKTAVVTLNRPRQKNALDPAINRRMLDVIAELRRDAGIRSVVLTGAGGSFCSGADLKGELPEGVEKTFFARDFLLDTQRWVTQLVDLEKPVVAAVDGFAIGAGMSLAFAADFVIASDRARFVASFPRVGLVPDLSLLYVLPRIVGLPRAKEIVFSARDIGAAEALSLGLVQAVVQAEQLRDAAIAFAGRFNDAPTPMLGMAKSALNRAFETDRQGLALLESAMQALCTSSSYHHEAVRRFQAREAPQYGGAPAFDFNHR